MRLNESQLRNLVQRLVDEAAPPKNKRKAKAAKKEEDPIAAAGISLKSGQKLYVYAQGRDKPILESEIVGDELHTDLLRERTPDGRLPTLDQLGVPDNDFARTLVKQSEDEAMKYFKQNLQETQFMKTFTGSEDIFSSAVYRPSPDTTFGVSFSREPNTRLTRTSLTVQVTVMEPMSAVREKIKSILEKGSSLYTVTNTPR